MAHGGIATLAIVFALGYAAFGLANSVAREVVSVLQQRGFDEEGGGTPLSFTIDETTISYAEVLLYAIAVALVLLFLLGTWLLTRRTTSVCPECRSSVPATASICRFCTTELSPPGADA
jgi:hypothetical protein